MAVAAAFGGVSPNFDPLYNNVSALSRRLSIASPREINDPGQTLQLKIKDLNNPNGAPQVFDAYMKPFYAADGTPISYNLFYKDANNDERQITRFNLDGSTPPRLRNQYVALDSDANTEYSINGQVIDLNNQLMVDINSGRIRYRNITTANVGNGGGTYPDIPIPVADYTPGAGGSIDLGVVKFEGATGLDVGIINDRISQVNMAIEALNKVLLVASGNIDKAVDLRL